MSWLLVGGVLYTVGSLFYLLKRMPYNHTVWHLFVMGGSAAHFVTIAFYVLPAAPL
jgi:hemolysin III